MWGKKENKKRKGRKQGLSTVLDWTALLYIRGESLARTTKSHRPCLPVLLAAGSGFCSLLRNTFRVSWRYLCLRARVDVDVDVDADADDPGYPLLFDPFPLPLRPRRTGHPGAGGLVP